MKLKHGPDQLREMAWQIRMDTIEAIYAAGSGHPGGALSIAEMLSVLYFSEMNIDPARPDMPERDRFVLSKGHAAPALYAALANRGYFAREELSSLRKLGSRLQGHPDKNKTPGVDMSTGSLGQGFSAAAGMAYFAKKRGCPFKVYCILGDGETQEGQVWEAAMAAAHYRLDNLTAILDHNGLQIDGKTDEVMRIDPIADKFRAFHWNILHVDGHDVEALVAALGQAASITGSPTIIIAETIKGKGIPFMENQVGWHGAAINQAQYEKAKVSLQEQQKRCREGEA